MRSFRSAQLEKGFKLLCEKHSCFERTVVTLWSPFERCRSESRSGQEHINVRQFLLLKEDLQKEQSESDSVCPSATGTDSDFDGINVSKLNRRSSYVKDSHIGRKLVEAIMKNRVNPKAPILDIQAGPGTVSKEFLRQGVSQVVALERRKIFRPRLFAIQEEHGVEKFQYFNWHMLNYFFKFNDQETDVNNSSYRTMEESVSNFLSNSPYRHTDTPYSLFSTGGNEEKYGAIFYALRNVPLEDKIVSAGRIEFFLIVHPKVKFCVESVLPLDKPTRYKRASSYLHTFMALFYDITFIEEFHRSDFFPPFGRAKQVDDDWSLDYRYLMRMQIKENVSEILPFEHHYPFILFLKHLLHGRKARIIPAMEMFVSGCGIQMLANGYNMMDLVMNISPLRLLDLYKDMVTWPEYGVSHLKNYIDLKTQGAVAKNIEAGHL